MTPRSSASSLRYPLVCFDLDGTLVDDTIYIWKTLHEAFDTDGPARQQAASDFFAGRISYRQWFEHDLVLLRHAGATRPAMVSLLDQLRPMNGAMETLRTLRQNGHRIAVVSGSIDLVISRLFHDFTFDHVLINTLHFHPDGTLSGGRHTPFDIEKKADGLHELCRREGLTPEQTVFVGDNENDLWIANAAGKAIAFNCKSSKLADIADVTISEKDLRRILPHIVFDFATD